MARDTSQYVVDGVRWPSVTEALSIAGFVDFGGADPEDVRRAGERGQDVHAWTEQLDQGRLLSVKPPTNIAGYVEGWHKFVKDADWKPVAIEMVVRCEVYGFVGTLDRVGEVRGRLSLLDISCASALPAYKPLQTAAYLHALASMDWPLGTVGPRYALHLKPNGTYKLDPHTSREDCNDFLAALRTTHWKLRHGLARIEEH